MDKILIIDDSRLHAEALKVILQGSYEITVRNTAKGGLDSAKSGKYSLILLDVVMPDIDGFTLLKELQEDSMTRYIPVILITSLSDIQHEEKGLMMGAVDYIGKPFNAVIVKARVDTHIKLYKYQTEFRQQAMYDELTGVANRRSYNKESLAKWRQAISLGIPVSICMMDVDKFKMYNDSFGHPAGDKVLASVAKTASSFLRRATDFFARYGGEEFVGVMIGGDLEADFRLMKIIRHAVEDLHIPHTASVSPWVTISMGGVTVVPKAEDTFEDYQKLADNMLYEAKQSGRNRVAWTDGNGNKWFEKEN